MENAYYAIMIIGYGAKRRYKIVDVIGNTIYPVHKFRLFRSEAIARQAAEEAGYEIEKVGDLYQIL